MSKDRNPQYINRLATKLWQMAQAGYRMVGRGGLMTTAEELAYAAEHDGKGAFFAYVTQQNFREHLPLDGSAELDAMGIISRYVPGSEMVILVKETKPGGRVRLHTYRIRVELAYIQEGNGEVQ